MYISNDSNIILKYCHFYTSHAQQRITFVNGYSSSMIMRFTQINNMNRAIFIYLFIDALVSVFQLLTSNAPKNLTVLKPTVAGTLGPVFIVCRQNHLMPYML